MFSKELTGTSSGLPPVRLCTLPVSVSTWSFKGINNLSMKITPQHFPTLYELSVACGVLEAQMLLRMIKLKERSRQGYTL